MSRPNAQEKLAILERRKNVARRYLRGDLQHEIARVFEVDLRTIERDLHELREEWRKTALADTAEFKALQLAKLDEVERNAWIGWTKSQENAETLRARKRGDESETEKVSKGQAGDPRFLAIVLECVEKRCKILGVAGQSPTGADETPEESMSEPERIALIVAFLGRAGFAIVPPIGSAWPRLEGPRNTPGQDSPGSDSDLRPSGHDPGPLAGEAPPLDE